MATPVTLSPLANAGCRSPRYITPSRAAEDMLHSRPRREGSLVGHVAVTPAAGAPVLPSLRERAPAAAAVEDLYRWLNFSYEDVADLIGCSRSNVFYWKARAESGHSVRPRTASVVRLFQIHSLLRAGANALGSENEENAVLRWATAEVPGFGCTPLTLLREGRIESAYEAARSLLYDTTPKGRTPATERTVAPPEPDLPVTPLHGAERRVTVVRPAGSDDR